MDRIHHTQPDEALRRILAEPSHPARITAQVIARLTDRTRYDQPVGQHLLPALKDASRAVMDGMPDTIRTHAHSVMYDVVTGTWRDGDETCGEYAIRLRDAAKGL